MIIITRYVKELGEVLETRSVAELEKFLKKWVKKGVIDAHQYKRFMLSSDETKLGTLCKMICNRLDTKEETKQWAREQLDKLGMRDYFTY